MVGETADCNLHAAFEGLCYCRLYLPHLVCLVGGGVGPILPMAMWRGGRDKEG